MKIKDSLLLPILASFVLLLPAFGGGMGEQHVVFFSIFISAAYVLSVRKLPANNAAIPVFLFLFLNVLLFVSWWQDIEKGVAGFSDIPSLLRPIGLAVVYAAVVVFLSKSREDLIVILDKLFICLFFSIFFFFSLSMLFNGYDEFVKRWYFPQERFKDNAFLSVFASTYFAAYFYYMIFIYALCRVWFFKLEVKWIFVLFLTVVFIFSSQSKTAYLAMFVSFLIAAFLRHGILNKFFVVFLCFLIFGIFVWQGESLYSALSTADVYSFRQTYLILEKGFEFVSVSERVNQIVSAYNFSIDNFLTGVGLGRGVYLESFISSYIYRYGIIGFVIYCVFYLYVAIRAFSLYVSSQTGQGRLLSVFVFIWIMNVPILMLSNPMFEMGKNSIFSALLLGVFFAHALKERQSRYNLASDCRVKGARERSVCAAGHLSN